MTTTYKVTIDAEIYVMTDDGSTEAIRIACEQLPLRDNWRHDEIQVEELDEEPWDEIVYTGDIQPDDEKGGKT